MKIAEDGFIHTPDPKLAPSRTDHDGVFVAGTAAGPKDIPDSIVEAGAAALEAAAYLKRTRGTAESASFAPSMAVQTDCS